MKKWLILAVGLAVTVVAFFLVLQPPMRPIGPVPPELVGEKKQAKPFSPPVLNLSAESRKELLSRARSAVAQAVDGYRPSSDPSSNPELQVQAGCFVTLKRSGELRGCIGTFASEEPLWQTVAAVAVSSAREDYRFRHNPIRSEEVPSLDIEVSVLSPMTETSRPLEEIKLGRDGIMIVDQGRSGTFLPQVATETGWSLEEFLGHCARDKAGLAWDGWRSPTARVLRYTATVVCEKDFHPVERK
jgi:MEMO1 family protein